MKTLVKYTYHDRKYNEKHTMVHQKIDFCDIDSNWKALDWISSRQGNKILYTVKFKRKWDSTDVQFRLYLCWNKQDIWYKYIVLVYMCVYCKTVYDLNERGKCHHIYLNDW